MYNDSKFINYINEISIGDSQFSNRWKFTNGQIRMVVEGCKRNGCHSGLCGQAPSDYPEMAEFLVETGIDSMSLNPELVLKTTRHILEVEKKLGRSSRKP